MIALAQQSNILDEVIHGEALAVLRTLPDNSVDAIVCDPPAGISFMGKDWDDPDYFPLRDRGPRLTGSGNPTESRGFARGITLDSSKKARDTFISWLSEVMAEALRVLKPGGHAFVWSLPRTSHWTGIALEDAGFEIRDCVNHFYDASTLMQQFLASLTPSQSDAFKALMDSQSAPSLVSHIFGSGFPKSADISKMIDKMHGAEREVIGKRTDRASKPVMDMRGGKLIGGKSSGIDCSDITAPATPEAEQWNGWGTSLKPASENWWLCRKPLSEKNIASNILKWGTGAINIDASRVGYTNEADYEQARAGTQRMFNNVRDQKNTEGWARPWNDTNPRTDADKIVKPQGRWPSNLLLSHSVWCVPNGVKKVSANRWGKNGQAHAQAHKGYIYGAHTETRTRTYEDSEGMEQVEDWLCDESCPIRLLDEQSGMRKSGGKERMTTIGYGQDSNHTFDRVVNHEASEGGASRYFQRFAYIPKASRSERNRGCEGLPYKTPGECTDRKDGSAGLNNPRAGAGRTAGGFNTHPTVKSIALCRYLVRLITPPGGIVLDCFVGSGSTLVAAIHEGMHFIGIEMNDSEQEPYVSIARARIEQAFREVQS